MHSRSSRGDDSNEHDSGRTVLLDRDPCTSSDVSEPETRTERLPVSKEVDKQQIQYIVGGDGAIGTSFLFNRFFNSDIYEMEAEEIFMWLDELSIPILCTTLLFNESNISFDSFCYLCSVCDKLYALPDNVTECGEEPSAACFLEMFRSEWPKQFNEASLDLAEITPIHYTARNIYTAYNAFIRGAYAFLQQKKIDDSFFFKFWIDTKQNLSSFARNVIEVDVDSKKLKLPDSNIIKQNIRFILEDKVVFKGDDSKSIEIFLLLNIYIPCVNGYKNRKRHVLEFICNLVEEKVGCSATEMETNEELDMRILTAMKYMMLESKDVNSRLSLGTALLIHVYFPEVLSKDVYSAQREKCFRECITKLKKEDMEKQKTKIYNLSFLSRLQLDEDIDVFLSVLNSQRCMWVFPSFMCSNITRVYRRKSEFFIFIKEFGDVVISYLSRNKIQPSTNVSKRLQFIKDAGLHNVTTKTFTKTPVKKQKIMSSSKKRSATYARCEPSTSLAAQPEEKELHDEGCSNNAEEKSVVPRKRAKNRSTKNSVTDADCDTEISSLVPFSRLLDVLPRFKSAKTHWSVFSHVANAPGQQPQQDTDQEAFQKTWIQLRDQIYEYCSRINDISLEGEEETSILCRVDNAIAQTRDSCQKLLECAENLEDGVTISCMSEKNVEDENPLITILPPGSHNIVYVSRVVCACTAYRSSQYSPHIVLMYMLNLIGNLNRSICPMHAVFFIPPRPPKYIGFNRFIIEKDTETDEDTGFSPILHCGARPLGNRPYYSTIFSSILSPENPATTSNDLISIVSALPKIGKTKTLSEAQEINILCFLCILFLTGITYRQKKRGIMVHTETYRGVIQGYVTNTDIPSLVDFDEDTLVKDDTLLSEKIQENIEEMCAELSFDQETRKLIPIAPEFLDEKYKEGIVSASKKYKNFIAQEIYSWNLPILESIPSILLRFRVLKRLDILLDFFTSFSE